MCWGETSLIVYARIFHSSVYPQIEDYSMVSFIPLNIRDEDSIAYVLSNIDNAIQYGEDIEPKVRRWKAKLGGVLHGFYF